MTNSITVRYDENFEYMLKCAAKAGFKEVLIGLGACDALLKDDYNREIERLQQLLEENGLKCTQTHLPDYHLTISCEETTKEKELMIKRAIEVSGKLGASWTTIHPRTAVNAGYSRKVSFESNKAKLSEYLEIAEKSEVGLAVENMPLYPIMNPLWRFFGGGWEELGELCEVLNSDKIGVCWDFGHANTASLDQEAAIKELGSLIKMTHVHDNYRNGDHHQLPLMGDLLWGCIDWKKPMGALKEINYTGTLALELVYPPIEMCESFVKLGYESLEKLKRL